MTCTSPQMTIQLENILHSTNRANASQTELRTLRHGGGLRQADDSQEIVTNYVGCGALVVGCGVVGVIQISQGKSELPPRPTNWLRINGYKLWVVGCGVRGVVGVIQISQGKSELPPRPTNWLRINGYKLWVVGCGDRGVVGVIQISQGKSELPPRPTQIDCV